MPHLLDDFLTKKRTEDGSPFGSARSAQTPPGTAKCDQILRPTLIAVDPGKASFIVATGLEGEHDLIDESAPETVALLETVLPRTLDLVVEVVDKPIQRRLSRLPGTVKRGTGCRQKQGPPCLQKTQTALRTCCSTWLDCWHGL